ncbi:MAG: CRISPR-associated helicase Cas3' [Acidobacteriota bacterium]
MIKDFDSYDEFFSNVFVGKDNKPQQPFDYQRRLALDNYLPAMVNVPTGAGKTNGVIGAWLWRRLKSPDTIGRRLVYCLPMRTLVEQTEAVAQQAIARLKAIFPERFKNLKVFVLMGGDISDEWDCYPERECILIGTQDMLLSRALNRGYAMSRFRWPIHFGLLNNDCLWVLDEVQLMGDGLATTAQLAAFREQFKTFGHCHSIWMSATLDREWLKQIDFVSRVEQLKLLELSDKDRAVEKLKKRLTAIKHLSKAPQICRLPSGLAKFIKENHYPGTQTLIVVNRVARAQETFIALHELYHPPMPKSKRNALLPPNSDAPELLLIHSRFRSHERTALARKLNDSPAANSSGRIIISTQVVEAGVDLSSRLLITDLSPFASLVQRFGRCNRAAEFPEAQIFWVDRPLSEKDAERLADKPELEGKERDRIAAPYQWSDLETAQHLLTKMTSAALENLPIHSDPYIPAHVLRRRDLVDLFDTTTDLSGYDLDVSRFVRGGDIRDVSVAWRKLDSNSPSRKDPQLSRDELCTVPIGEFKEFLKSGDLRVAWVWDALESEWRKINEGELRPGLLLLLDIKAGGYDTRQGWNRFSKEPVDSVPQETIEENEGLDDEPLSVRNYCQKLASHSREAKAEVERILIALNSLKLAEWSADLIYATHHHDWGKAHAIFQETLHKGLNESWHEILLAKSNSHSRHSRKHFRHELASALALLQTGASDLAVYLAACHHGKVRLSIRALPGEDKPDKENLMFARGIWHGEKLPAVDLGDGEQKPEVTLDLEPMLLGVGQNNAPSWLERMLMLRERLGVFRLAYLESLIRAADVRASINPQDYWS